MPGDVTGSSGQQRNETFRRLDAFTFALLVLGHAVFNILFSPFGSSVSEYPLAWAYIAIGVIGAQPILFAMWAALGPQSFFKRFSWAACACILITYAQSIPSFRLVGESSSLDPFQNMPFTLGLFIVTFLALLVPRRVLSWRIGRQIGNGAEWSKDSASKDSQFSLKYLLGWIAGSAALLAFGRFIADEQATSQSLNTPTQTLAQVASFLGIMFVLLLPTAGVPWMTLAYGRQARLFVVATLIAWGALTWAAVSALRAQTPISSREAVETVVFIQLGAATAGFITALILRFSGFRLRRIVDEK